MSATLEPSMDQEIDLADALASFPIFNDLPEAVTSAIQSNADHRFYDSGHTVFTNGQFDASEFFVILSGKFRLSLVEPNSGAVMIEEFAEGSIFGLELSIGDEEYAFCDFLSATADGDLEVLAIDSAVFKKLASTRPSLMRNIATFIASELSKVRFDPVRSEAAPYQRVYAALLDFVERDATTGQWRIQQMPKHRHLADKANVEEVVTADAVANLIQEGIVQREYPGMIINDMSRLNELAS